MPKISVIGVGGVGATLAYTLQISGLATEIVLVDSNRQTALGNAMDMNHGLFFTPPAKIRAGDFPDCAGSDLIVITAGARQKPDETRLELTNRNAAICTSIVRELEPHIGEAKILMISNPVDVMTHVVLEASKLPSNRVFGSGTVLDSARFRYELSHRCGVDARNVHAYVIGEHGDSEVFLWSQVHIGVMPLEVCCQECDRGCIPDERREIQERVRKSAYHIIEAKGYTNYGVSLAVRRIIEAILRNERSLLTVSTLLHGEYGLENVCISVPCLVGSNGIERVMETPLADDDRDGLMNSAQVLKSAILALK
ncbi:MAG: L-lactate dehydrogenase [Chloroflexota bacterium]